MTIIVTYCPAFQQYCDCRTDCQEPAPDTVDVQESISKLQTDLSPPAESVRRQSSRPTVQTPRTPGGPVARPLPDDTMRRGDPRLTYGFQPAGAPETDRTALQRTLREAAANTRALQDKMEMTE